MTNYSNLNKTYTCFINGERVEILKNHRTRTQYEYYLTIFMGNSQYESIRNYETMFLTLKAAIKHAKYAIFEAPQPRIEKILFIDLKATK